MQSNGQEITLDTRAAEYAKQLVERFSIPGGPSEYLKQHGISDLEIVERYQLGCVAYPLPGDERFRGSISIPYQSRSGIVAITYRCVLGHECADHGHSKYQQYSGQEAQIYNKASFFHANGRIGISEGEMDAVAATEFLGIPTLGISGAKKWAAHKETWKHCLKDYSTVVIWADGDEAGMANARGIAEDLGRKAVIVRCDGDVSSMVSAGRGEELRRRAGM